MSGPGKPIFHLPSAYYHNRPMDLDQISSSSSECRHFPQAIPDIDTTLWKIPQNLDFQQSENSLNPEFSISSFPERSISPPEFPKLPKLPKLPTVNPYLSNPNPPPGSVPSLYNSTFGSSGPTQLLNISGLPVDCIQLNPPVIENSSVLILKANEYLPRDIPLHKRIKSTRSNLKAFERFNFFEKVRRIFPSFYYEIEKNRIKFRGNSQELLKIESYINEYQNKLNFNDDEWAYLDDNGDYNKYPPNVCRMIESKYREIYLVLLEDENYQDYSESVCFNYSNKQSQVKFARIGGVHCQVTKISSSASVLSSASSDSVDSMKSVIQDILSNKAIKEFNFEHETTRIVRRQNEIEVIEKRPVYWKWKHESGKFRPYEKDADFLIEHYYLKYLQTKENSLVMIQGSNGKTYMICFDPMFQYNEVTRFRRKIKRDVPA